MSESWDVESYRTEFESEEHWELRKNFMLAHKDRLPEDEIVCLAQVFTNIEFLGCRYPDETMRKVAELAKGVVESYREKKKNCLKRTFVAASDAAASKVKGLSSSTRNANKKFEIANKMKNDFRHFNQIENENFSIIECNQPNDSYIKNCVRSDQIGRGATQNAKSESSFTHDTIIKKLKGPFADFIFFLFDEHPVNLLQRNASLNKYSISWKYETTNNDTVICSVYLNDHLTGTAEARNKKMSREFAGKKAVEKLQSSCYTIKIKALFASQSAITPDELGCSPDEESFSNCQVGEQIMKLMGWTGGGLGVKQQGMTEPVSLLSNLGRSGLGLNRTGDDDQKFKIRARDFIRKWVESNSDQDLVFSSEFSVDQRKILHELARNLSLKSKSYGKGEHRYLVVSKTPSPWQIVEELVKIGGSTTRYELMVPNAVE